MTAVQVWTYQDAIDHLVDVYDLDRSGRSLRLCKEAILSAYRELPNLHTWSYYQKSAAVATVASQNTGTVVYDHTGGAYERMVTLTGATWPSWAEFGEVKIGGVDYRIAERKSDTVITLETDLNPGADVASTTYTVFRTSYPLPLDLRRLDRVVQLSDKYEMDNVSAPTEHANSVYIFNSPSTPWTYTILHDVNYIDTLAIRFSPPPNLAKLIGFVYERSPRYLRTDTYSTGTITVNGSPTPTVTVTGSSTAFLSIHVGSLLRISNSASVAPTSPTGLQPPDYERIIFTVDSGTSMTVDAEIPTDYSGVKYTISDPLDLESNSMLSVFWRMIEWNFAKITDREDANDRGQRFLMELDFARNADRRTTSMQTASQAEETWYGLWGDVTVR